MENREDCDNINSIIGDDGWYRGRDLMNSQKKLLYQTMMQRIQEQIGEMEQELAYLLSIKENHSKRYRKLERLLQKMKAENRDERQQQMVEEQMRITDDAQGRIFLALQPLFHKIFNEVAEQIPPGKAYNEALRTDLRFDLIFGERDISGPTDGPREHYRYDAISRTKEERIQKKAEKLAKEKQKIKEKLRIPKDHRLITKENYQEFIGEIIKAMEDCFLNNTKNLTSSNPDQSFQKHMIELRFLYVFIWALINKKLVFNIKSARGSEFVGNVINNIFCYFEKKIGSKLEIEQKYLIKKLRNNTKVYDKYPLDLSYEHALLEDIEFWEKYLDRTYFIPQQTNLDKIRLQIMEEYNSQKGVRELSFELLNPWYHIYKRDEEKHQKHLSILLEHQKKTKDDDPHLQEIIEDVQKKITYAQEKKQEHTTCIESRLKDIKPTYDYSLTEIRNKFLKKYKVPFQYRHIFGIVMNKVNNFYQLKANIRKKSEEINMQLIYNVLNSDGQEKDIFYFLHNYITFKHMDEIFEKRRKEKRNERKMKLYYTIKDEKHLIKMKKESLSKPSVQKTNDSRKKIPYVPDNQLSLDL